MQERLKQLRSYFHMTQSEFAKKLGVGQSTLAMMEVNKRDISDRHIKTICAIFGVDENWFRTGEGEMFSPKNNNDGLDELSNRYNLNTLDRHIIMQYLALDPAQRAVIYNFLRSLVLPSANEQGATLSVEEAESEYIKSCSNFVQKMASSASTITNDTKTEKQA